jgi:hypothetical protein
MRGEVVVWKERAFWGSDGVMMFKDNYRQSFKCW